MTLMILSFFYPTLFNSSDEGLPLEFCNTALAQIPVTRVMALPQTMKTV